MVFPSVFAEINTNKSKIWVDPKFQDRFGLIWSCFGLFTELFLSIRIFENLNSNTNIHKMLFSRKFQNTVGLYLGCFDLFPKLFPS